MRRLVIRVGIVLACGIGLLLLGGWLGDLWLESAGGRRLLQHELSKAIGSPASLMISRLLIPAPRTVSILATLSGGKPIEAPSFARAS